MTQTAISVQVIHAPVLYVTPIILQLLSSTMITRLCFRTPPQLPAMLKISSLPNRNGESAELDAFLHDMT
jgi:hypothetical protein